MTEYGVRRETVFDGDTVEIDDDETVVDTARHGTSVTLFILSPVETITCGYYEEGMDKPCERETGGERCWQHD